MDSWHSYPSIYQLGHRAVAELMNGSVLVEEKVDGSQFSMGISEDGEIKLRSKGAILNVDAPEKMFAAAVGTVKELAVVLHPGWTYRCEYLQKPKHNALAYSRIPARHLIVFDVNTGHESYLSYLDKIHEAERIGLECVPLIYSGMVTDIGLFRSFLDRESLLGGVKIEGVVIKPERYDLFGADKKALMAKYVSEAYKEVQAGEWKKENPTNKDVLDALCAAYRSEARWTKAVQHLTDAGALEGSPRDIGKLIKEVPTDILKEDVEAIKDRLFAWAWAHISRASVRGLAEWYKNELAKRAFEGKDDAS